MATPPKTKSVENLLKQSNADVFNAVRNSASTTFQDRIPAADQGDLAQTMRQLDQFGQSMWNEFADALVNRIGMVIMQTNSWSNPLKYLKRGMMEYGDKIEEVRMNLIEAHRYDPNKCYEDVFACNPPEIATAFHTINRQDTYYYTLNEMLLRRAMVNEGQLAQVVNEASNLPYLSDEVDEYLIMKNLFKLYEETYGYYKIQVPAIENTLNSTEVEQQAKFIAQQIDEIKYMFDFMKSDYNGLGWPTTSRGYDIIVFAEPHLASVLDTYVLPFAFRETNAINLHVIPIDHFDIDGCQAIVCDERHIMCWDTYMAFKSIENPKGRSWNYFWHHDGIYSLSYFVNAVMFTTNAGTAVVKPSFDVTAVAVSIDGTETFATAGEDLRLKATVTGSVTPTGADIDIPQAAIWTISATDGVPLAQRTYIDPEGVLHVDANEKNTKVTVTATSPYPSKAEATKGQLISGSLVIGIGAVVPVEPTE